MHSGARWGEGARCLFGEGDESRNLARGGCESCKMAPAVLVPGTGLAASAGVADVVSVSGTSADSCANDEA